ncbi:MAG TPA: twin-arginine translocation signal domain-containing protein [Vicinamibacteria bacterium]|nr:twin-arginine translocation signal domain-containing protein [Vicinamibacteria bacterium]
MIRRRDFVKAGAAVAAMAALPEKARADVPVHLWQGYDFGPGPKVSDRLNQGPFGIDQDEGWYTVETTTASDEPVRNFGLGLVGYTWEENGPALAVREGRQSLEDAVEALARLPFVDVLYIRCDWRDVQSRPGRLDLHPVWALTFDAAKRHGLRVGFRVQLSNPEIQPAKLALPDFLQAKIPLATLRAPRPGRPARVEPRYDHPEFLRAFAELDRLLAERFDPDPLVEFVDLMMYGFWGEGHTSDYASPFPDPWTAERTFVEMTREQLEAWKRVPLAVNTQPDISRTGNHEVQDLAVRGGSWLRSDSIILDEPVQIESLAHRPPWLAVIMEDGYHRHYRTDTESYRVDAAGVSVIDRALLHTLDLGGNYWSLWTEAENLARYHGARPAALERLRRRIGYRVRPSWIWQRKRYGTAELVVAFANDGVAGVPGVLRAAVETPDGKVRVAGGLDAGHPFAGGLRLASFVLPQGLDGREVVLKAEVETNGVRRPVRWACAQPLDPNGSLVVRLKPHDDRGWRKGI